MISKIALAILGLALVATMLAWPNQMSWELMALISFGTGVLFQLRLNHLKAKSQVSMEDEDEGSWVSLIFLVVAATVGTGVSLYNELRWWPSAVIGFLNVLAVFLTVQLTRKATEQKSESVRGHD